ncbi:MAG TPA: 30S ribosome-binding factor RbfA [Bryobacteraceae bacterium]|nr:30S ribosome-binding factor RbfA [Bryobacteraceae bacterium]
MDERRSQRVSEAVREELAEIIGFELDDPRVGPVSISTVHVSPDSRHARVKVVLRGDDAEQKEALAALDHARHYLRRELAARLSLRMAPELHFEVDRWDEADNRLAILLKRAKKTRGRTENEA